MKVEASNWNNEVIQSAKKQKDQLFNFCNNGQHFEVLSDEEVT